MSYQALYRKFRPNTFDEVKGQDHIVTTLKNQINSDRIGHAYLFCGTRGTGKTSVAKIFARAVNCENPVDGSPCMECEVCKSSEGGAAPNIIEMDAASNNGVDDVRKIIEEINTDKKKVENPATTISETDDEIIVSIDEIYMESILEVYGKYTTPIMAGIKSVIHMLSILQEELAEKIKRFISEKTKSKEV